MTWTDPRTWVVDEVVTAAQLNTHLRDNIKAVAHPYDKGVTDLDVVSTAAETTIYSKSITGGDMGSDGSLELLLAGDVLFNNNAADTIRLKVKFGGTTILDDACDGGIGANRMPWVFRVWIVNAGATAQLVTAELQVNNPGVSFSPTTGIGGYSFTGGNFAGGLMQNTAAVNTASIQTLEVSAQWSASSANNSWRRRLAILRLAQN